MCALLIGDIGATGSDWYYHGLTDKITFSSIGFNPKSQGEDRLQKMLDDLVTKVSTTPVDLHYYGAGIGSEEDEQKILDAFREKVVVSSYTLYPDILGAARSVCQDDKGIVCLLGTGSSVCHYDGQSAESGNSLGYPLGDEGSGMDIGRRIVKSYYYQQMTSSVRDHFGEILPRDRLDFVSRLRDHIAPNQFLAELVPEVLSIKQEPFIQKLLSDSFDDFIKSHLSSVESEQIINVVGSIGFYFSTEFGQCLNRHGLVLGEVLRRPIQGLSGYHLAKRTENE